MTRTSTLITSNPVGPNKIELVAMIPGQEGIIHSKKKWVFAVLDVRGKPNNSQ